MLPLCEIRAIGPGGTSQPIALTRPEPLKSPAQLGPTSRAPLARATATSSCSTRLPSAPVSPKPAVMTTMPRTPAATQSETAPGTSSGRTSTMASSTGPGTSRSDGYALRPRISDAVG